MDPGRRAAHHPAGGKLCRGRPRGRALLSGFYPLNPIGFSARHDSVPRIQVWRLRMKFGAKWVVIFVIVGFGEARGAAAQDVATARVPKPIIITRIFTGPDGLS